MSRRIVGFLSPQSWAFFGVALEEIFALEKNLPTIVKRDFW